MKEYVKISRKNYDDIMLDLQHYKKQEELLEEGGCIIENIGSYRERIYSKQPAEEYIVNQIKEMKSELSSALKKKDTYEKELFLVKSMDVCQFKAWRKKQVQDLNR